MHSKKRGRERETLLYTQTCTQLWRKIRRNRKLQMHKQITAKYALQMHSTRP